MNLKEKIKKELGIILMFDILLITEAIIEKEKYGQLSPKTIENLKIIYH